MADINWRPKLVDPSGDAPDRTGAGEPIWDIIDISGPAIALASSGSADAHTVEICSAMGSHIRFHVSNVLSTQSDGVHPTAFVVPAGRAEAPSSHVSARWTASAIAEVVLAGIGATNPIEFDARRRASS